MIITTLLLCGCIVAHRRYVLPSDKEASLFKLDGMNFSCEISTGDPKDVTVYVSIDSVTGDQGVSDLSISLVAGGTKLKPEKVGMICLEKDIGKLFDDRFVKESFKELPVEFRKTHIDGFKVTYTFKFESESEIKAERLIMKYELKLADIQYISNSVELQMVESKTFSVH